MFLFCSAQRLAPRRDTLPTMQRPIFSAAPPSGDYILNPTGVSWGVRRTNGDGSALAISDGARNKKTAVAAMLSLAESDKTDAWEPAGPGSFRLVQRYRRSG